MKEVALLSAPPATGITVHVSPGRRPKRCQRNVEVMMLTPQELKLQDVMITCPSTDLPLATGVQLSSAVFATAIFTNVRLQCPHCGGEHRWNNADAFLVEVERGAAPPMSAFGRRSRH